MQLLPVAQYPFPAPTRRNEEVQSAHKSMGYKIQNLLYLRSIQHDLSLGFCLATLADEFYRAPVELRTVCHSFPAGGQ